MALGTLSAEMRPVMRAFKLAVLVAALGSATPGLVAAETAEKEVIGAKEFQRSCQPCHGAGGRGDGPVSEFLNVKPADLTLIRKNNDGLFPIFDVIQIIDGTTLVPVHGERAMPIWGDRYLTEDGGTYKGLTGEEGVRLRILELLYYIQSIQQ